MVISQTHPSSPSRQIAVEGENLIGGVIKHYLKKKKKKEIYQESLEQVLL